MNDMMIGVDLAKSVFQIHGALRSGEFQFRKKLTRAQFSAFMAQQKSCLAVIEACGSAHYWSREVEALGHDVKLIPPQYVRPFVKRQMLKQLSSRRVNLRCVSWNPRQLSSNPVLRSSGLGNVLSFREQLM
ncbi:IS110 family transposase [Tritonibacter mobilis]|uniref:IS110 family transposase n=1 Tax=Tritonibacter mobilis TaxID=379347 RepID=UPI000806E7F8|nr:IS110 family transposase [Tritonibacter mobilis]